MNEINEESHYTLPKVYLDYLEHSDLTPQSRNKQMKAVKRILSRLHNYLEKVDLDLDKLTIDHIDAFLAELNAHYASSTQRLHRSFIRGFLSYLYYQRGILKRNLAPLIVGPPLFAQSKPPCFLRPDEIKRLFENVRLSTVWEIRVYAMLHLAYTLGLRPQEICLITFDDINFTQRWLTLKYRKANNPITLPLSEPTIKAIVAYIIGARPDSEQRYLFLNINKPHKSITARTVSSDLGQLMKKAGLQATAYWLRHTYAQNMLENGASIFEVKEMLGHNHIESSKKYIHIHTKMMREVLFYEEI